MKTNLCLSLIFVIARLSAIAQLNDYAYLTVDSLGTEKSFTISPKSIIAIEARAALPKKPGSQPVWGIQWNRVDSAYNYLTLHLSADSA